MQRFEKVASIDLENRVSVLCCACFFFFSSAHFVSVFWSGFQKALSMVWCNSLDWTDYHNLHGLHFIRFNCHFFVCIWVTLHDIFVISCCCCTLNFKWIRLTVSIKFMRGSKKKSPADFHLNWYQTKKKNCSFYCAIAAHIFSHDVHVRGI